MPRIPVRTEPYSSPTRQHRHFKNKRDQILRALGKATFINGSQFAILWVNQRGESETYASETFQGRLKDWFNPALISEAKQLVFAHGSAATAHGKSRMFDKAQKDQENARFSPVSGAHDQAWPQHHGPPPSRLHFPQYNISPRKPLRQLDCSNKICSRRQSLDTSKSLPNQASSLAASLSAQEHLNGHNFRRTYSAPLLNVTTTSAPYNRAYSTAAPYNSMQTNLQQVEADSVQGDYRPLTIGSHGDVTLFLQSRLRGLQQNVCKIVAKAWIKVIEPKKQTRYPYNKGEESKPDWWPDSVRHKEPDHLMKPERVNLLLVLLRCGRIPVNRLELATAEVAAFIPSNKTNILREIYRVAREEERFHQGVIDGATKLMVTATVDNADAASDDISSPNYNDLSYPYEEFQIGQLARSQSVSGLKRSMSSKVDALAHRTEDDINPFDPCQAYSKKIKSEHSGPHPYHPMRAYNHSARPQEQKIQQINSKLEIIQGDTESHLMQTQHRSTDNVQSHHSKQQMSASDDIHVMPSRDTLHRQCLQQSHSHDNKYQTHSQQVQRSPSAQERQQQSQTFHNIGQAVSFVTTPTSEHIIRSGEIQHQQAIWSAECSIASNLRQPQESAMPLVSNAPISRSQLSMSTSNAPSNTRKTPQQLCKYGDPSRLSSPFLPTPLRYAYPPSSEGRTMAGGVSFSEFLNSPMSHTVRRSDDLEDGIAMDDPAATAAQNGSPRTIV